MKKDTYAGRIENCAAQHVKALFATSKSPKGKKIAGDDLRCGKGSK